MAIQTKTMVVKSDTALAETKTTIRDTVTFDTSKLPNGITYKGLKAVMSFADPIQWNKASTYDSLTVVWDDATHASYASKRPVPQNIELTNEFYWLRTADLDAQVEMYRQEVQQFDGRITANAQAIAAETVRAEGVESSLKNSKTVMLSFGDSFGDEPGEWPFKLAAKFGLKCDSFNIGGDVWPWRQGLKNAISKYDTDEKKSTIAFAVAYGGINQILNSPLTDETVITTFIDSFNAAFPNVKLYIAPMNNCSPANANFPNIYGNALKSYNPLMNKLRQYDGNFILLSNSIWYNTGALNSWKDDKLHPNALGSTMIANNMAMAITGTNTFSQSAPVFGEHNGWDIITDSYVADGYIVTCGAVNNKVTTASIYNYLYGIKPLIKVLNPSMAIKIPCEIYTDDGVYKKTEYAYYSVHENNLQSYINCTKLSYDATDIVHIMPTMIPLL